MNKNYTKRYMRAKELAIYLGISKSTIWLYHKMGKITSKKISSRVTLFDVEEVEKSLFSKN